jgi:hypothetical protein
MGIHGAAWHTRQQRSPDTMPMMWDGCGVIVMRLPTGHLLHVGQHSSTRVAAGHGCAEDRQDQGESLGVGHAVLRAMRSRIRDLRRA